MAPASPSPILDLDGQVALVCGATGFLGGAIARALAGRGARVALHTRRQPQRAEALVGALGGTVVCGDLGDWAQADAVFDAVHEQLGAPPAIVVNCAHPNPHATEIADLAPADARPHLDGFALHVNVCRRAIPGMRELGGGRIVAISGAMAERPFPGFALFSAMKAALNAFTRALALEVGRDGITVNAIAPGRVETPGGEAAAETDPAFDALDRVTRLRTALDAPPTPQDVARLAAFLASPEASAVTGQVVYLAAGEPV